jgi:EmrB/QacA subfamily drug resistance transporter
LNPPSEKRAILLAASASSFLTPFMSSSVNIALPRIGADLGMDAVSLGWVATAFLLAAAVFLVPFGRLADLRGRRAIFGAGALVYAGASGICGLAPSAAWLIAGRFVQGMGGAMIFGTGMALLTGAYPPGERGLALGINSAAVYLGLSLGPFVGGFMTQHLGWRSLFLAMVILSLAMSSLAALVRADEPAAHGETFDAAGAWLYGAALVALMLGLGRLPAASGAAVAAAGAAGIALFVRRCARVHHPVLNVRLFLDNAVFAFSNLAALIHYSATFAVTFLLSLYLQKVKGLGPQAAGLVLVAQPAMMTVFSPLSGRLSDRLEPRYVASTGMGITALSLAALSRLDADTGLPVILAELALLGFGFALFSSPNTNAVMSAVEKRALGVASGTLGTMRLVGQLLSMGLATVVLSLGIGHVPLAQARVPDFLTAQRAALLACAVLCTAGVFASLARGDIRRTS